MTFVPLHSGKYEFNGDGGEGVDAYIIDTGISVNHVDFHGRAKVGCITCLSQTLSPWLTIPSYLCSDSLHVVGQDHATE